MSEKNKAYICENCGKEFIKDWRKCKVGIPRFCSRSCANSRNFNNASKNKTSITLLKKYLNDNNVFYEENSSIEDLKLQTKMVSNELKIQKRNSLEENKRICIKCGSIFYKDDYSLKRSIYPGLCKECALKEAGHKSAAVRKKTSRSEDYFKNLCIEYGLDIECNSPIFNGYDADIIIPLYKLAIHWNGPWHYEGLIKNLKGYSWKQTENRDLYKYSVIEGLGYKNYIIKYIDRFDKDKIKIEFDKLISYIKDIDIAG